MSKRLTRITSGHIYEELGNLIGVKMTAISQNGKTCFGRLQSVSTDFVTIDDTRQHSHKLLISDLYEVIYDLNSTF